MRTSRSLLFSILFLAFTTFTAAWPWPRWLPELDALVVRQNDNNNDSSEPTAASTRAPKSTEGSRTTDNADSLVTDGPSSTDSSEESNTKSDKGSAKETGTGKSSNKSGSKSGTKTRTTSYDARLPAGGVAMITPAVIDGDQYFKVGDHVTFAWNYTSLEATPTAVNIMASCKANDQMYTIAMNQTVTNATQAITWDTGAYQRTAVSDPLLTEKYTLYIYDSGSSVSAQAQPGYLAVYNQYIFGMYTPQPYKPLGEYVCATCSGALSDVERRALGMVLGMSVLTVLSFTWFVGGTGVIW